MMAALKLAGRDAFDEVLADGLKGIRCSESSASC